MPIDEGYFSAADGEQLFYRFQTGIQSEKTILLIHGHGEHSGRYLKFFSRLKDLGRPIGIFDLRGCGRSGGYSVYVSRFEDYINDVSSFLDFLKTKYQVCLPICLFGHSLGGLIAAAWALERDGQISKLILSSPLFGIPMASAVRLLVKVLDPLVSRWIIKNPVRAGFLTHDPEEVKRYLADPLIRRSITVRLAREMLRYTDFFRKGKVQFPFPVYILMAEKDYIVDPAATRRFFDRVKATEKKLEAFPGFFHEIFNERGQERAFERLRYYLCK